MVKKKNLIWGITIIEAIVQATVGFFTWKIWKRIWPWSKEDKYEEPDKTISYDYDDPCDTTEEDIARLEGEGGPPPDLN